MFSQKPSYSASELDKNSQIIKALLSEKYLNVKVEDVSIASNNQIKITLLNGRHGLYDGIDEENERPIEYLKTFGAQIGKEKAKYPYWSYSTIFISESSLKDIIDGLKKLPIPRQDDNRDKVMAAC